MSKLQSALHDVELKIGVIGIGNAGSQVARAAAEEGHTVFVINSSVKDLDDRVLFPELKSYKIGDGRGSGKNRDNAMTLLTGDGKEGIVDIFNNPHFKACVDPADVVFVCFSTGGGTGSGIGPYISGLIKKAYQNNKLVIVFGILPKYNESVMAQANTIACVDDITELETPYMLADLEFCRDLPMEVAYEKIGKYMVKCVNTIRGDYLGWSADGMADERDVMTVISEPGYLAIHFAEGITENSLSGRTLQGCLIEEINNSPACRIQRDGLIASDLIISNCNSAITDPLKVGDLSELHTFIGEPKVTFNNYAISDSISAAQCIAVMSGLTIPMDRFAEPRAKVAANKAKFAKRSALRLSEAREETELAGNSQSTVMGSKHANTADLSFLDL